MAEYDGEVVIKARIDSDGLQGDASKISKNLNDSFTRSSQLLSNLQKQYNNFISGSTKTSEQLGLEKSLDSLGNRLDRLKIRYETIFNSLDKQYQGLFSAVREGKDVGTFNMGVYNDLMRRLTPLQDMINRTTARINELKERLNEVKLNPEAQTSVLKLEERINKLSTTVSTKLSPSFKNIGSGIGKVFSGIGGALSKGFSLLTAPIRGVIGLVSALGRQLFSIGKTAFILHGIRTGFKGMSEAISNVISSDKQFIVSLNQVKSNLVTAFYPIYQYILPALHTLMRALSVATSYLAQFVAHLFGQNYKAMQEGARSFAALSQGATNSSKSVNKNKNSFNELGKSIKKSTKELASFDKLNVLNIEKQKAVKQPKAKGFTFMPTSNFDAGYKNFLKGFDKFREKLMAKMQPTIDSFRELGETVKVKLGGFAAQAIKDFGTDFLEPATDYLLGTAIPKFNNITKNMIENTNWDNLNTALDNLWKALEPFGETIGNGLIWFYEHAIAPLMEWAVGELLPAALDVLSGALEFLNPIAEEAGKHLGFLWDKFLKPVAEWTGGVIVETLKGIGGALKTIGGWLKDNRWFVEGGAALIEGLAISTAGFAAALWIKNSGGLLGALKLVTDAFKTFMTTGALALLSNPWVLVIGVIIAGLVLLATHWDKVKEAAGKAMDWIQEKSQKVGGKLKDIWNKSIGWIVDKIRSLMDKLGGLGDKIKSAFGVSNLRGRIPKNRAANMVARPPAFAQGAVLKGGSPMLAYLNDQPRGQTNIETPLNTMIDAFNTALERNRSNINNNVIVEATGDVNSIISMLNFRIKQQNQLTGTNYIPDNIFS